LRRDRAISFFHRLTLPRADHHMVDDMLISQLRQWIASIAIFPLKSAL